MAKLTIYGYNQWFLIKPSVKVFKNGELVGKVGYAKTFVPNENVLSFDVEEDCALTFKSAGCEATYDAKKDADETIKVLWNRDTGKFSLQPIEETPNA